MQPKVAIVYDWIDKWGGVERILLTLHKLFPRATFFTSIYNPASAFWARKLTIKSSFMQRLPALVKTNRVASLPFYPFAFESFDFSDFDLVISVTSSFAKSVVTRPGTRHVSYLLTPTRFLWSHEKDYLKSPLLRMLLSGYTDYLRAWDKKAAKRPDEIIAISNAVKNRVKKYYGLPSRVIYPPFDAEYWNRIKQKTSANKSRTGSRYFLVVSRLEPYKRVDLAVEVFNKLKEKLVVVGEGSQKEDLRRMAKDNVVFVSRVSDEELSVLYRGAQALVMPQEEDFGYVALEAAFFGLPVISYQKGGAKEIIIEGKTGIFFDKQSKRSLQGAIERFKKIKYNLKRSTHEMSSTVIKRFDKEIFKKELKKIV